MPSFYRASRLAALVLLLSCHWASAQESLKTSADAADLRETVRALSARVTALEAELHADHAVLEAVAAAREPGPITALATAMPAAVNVRPSVEDIPGAPAAIPVSATSPGPSASIAAPGATVKRGMSPAAVLPTRLPGGATLNYYFDGYYDYDFKQPIGRVQYLRAYDVLSNAFSINQAGLVLAQDPDLAAGRRYGVRLDLQFGQATESSQGNPANETRPEIYRNIFQAYGTYVIPLKRGLTVDVGKWASSLGIEGNYTKDQMNYSRSFFFTFMPFYHEGVRTSFAFNDKLTANYWLVNGTNQTEPTNSFKDELFGLSLTPTKALSWNLNYYLGQEHPDSEPAANCTPPLQPGLCLQQINPAPNGKTHIFNSYAAWKATPTLTFGFEGDYYLTRKWAQAAAGESSAPSHVSGGAAYARYQMQPKMALALRTEYMSDHDGLFSGASQALKEFTGTYEYKFGEGFLARVEYRQDWSNKPYFLTDRPGVLANSQPTLTVGTVWWLGGKQGAW